MIVQNFVLSLLLVVLAAACKSSIKSMEEKMQSAEQQATFTAGPPALVYKTRADYSDKVAIILNPEKTEVVSYPHPQDIKHEQGFPYPTRLAEGYLLDNQGISEQVAFTTYTFAEYAALPQPPSRQELMDHILDKDPLLHLCYCGNRTAYENGVASMNSFIGEGLIACESIFRDDAAAEDAGAER